MKFKNVALIVCLLAGICLGATSNRAWSEEDTFKVGYVYGFPKEATIICDTYDQLKSIYTKNIANGWKAGLRRFYQLLLPANADGQSACSENGKPLLFKVLEKRDKMTGVQFPNGSYADLRIMWIEIVRSVDEGVVLPTGYRFFTRYMIGKPYYPS